MNYCTKIVRKKEKISKSQFKDIKFKINLSFNKIMCLTYFKIIITLNSLFIYPCIVSHKIDGTIHNTYS